MNILPLLLVAFLSGLAPSAPEKSPVLIIGGANNHWCAWTTPALAQTLEESGKFDVTVTEEPAEFLTDAAAVASYSTIVLDYNGPLGRGGREELPRRRRGRDRRRHHPRREQRLRRMEGIRGHLRSHVATGHRARPIPCLRR